MHFGITILTFRATEKKLIKLKAAKVRKAKNECTKKVTMKKLISIFSHWEEQESEWIERIREKKKLESQSGKNVDATKYVAVCSQQHVCCVLVHHSDAYSLHDIFFFARYPHPFHRDGNEWIEKKIGRKKRVMVKRVCLGMHCTIRGRLYAE